MALKFWFCSVHVAYRVRSEKTFEKVEVFETELNGLRVLFILTKSKTILGRKHVGWLSCQQIEEKEKRENFLSHREFIFRATVSLQNFRIAVFHRKRITAGSVNFC